MGRIKTKIKTKISKKIADKLLQKLLQEARDMNWGVSFLNSYLKLYRLGFYRVKGFNYIFQNSFIYLQ